MNGIHDMGGMEGFGPVQPEPNEPPFHSKWEGRALAMNRALGYAKIWNIDKSRAKIEEMPPHDYLTKTYYQKWAYRLEQLLIEYGYHRRGRGRRPDVRCARASRCRASCPPPRSTRRCRAAAIRASRPDPRVFKVGDRVRTRNIHPHTHTRLPRYARDKVGVVECVRGFHVFPDSVAIGEGENPQWLYTVLFDASELWGEAADPTLESLDRSLGALS